MATKKTTKKTAKTTTTTPKATKAQTAAKVKQGSAKTATHHGEKVITLLVKGNPKREGSKAHGRYAHYKDGMTITAFVKAGGQRVDIKWDLDHGHIAVA